MCASHIVNPPTQDPTPGPAFVASHPEEGRPCPLPHLLTNKWCRANWATVVCKQSGAIHTLDPPVCILLSLTIYLKQVWSLDPRYSHSLSILGTLISDAPIYPSLTRPRGDGREELGTRSHQALKSLRITMEHCFWKERPPRGGQPLPIAAFAHSLGDGREELGMRSQEHDPGSHSKPSLQLSSRSSIPDFGNCLFMVTGLFQALTTLD